MVANILNHRTNRKGKDETAYINNDEGKDGKKNERKNIQISIYLLAFAELRGWLNDIFQ